MNELIKIGTLYLPAYVSQLTRYDAQEWANTYYYDYYKLQCKKKTKYHKKCRKCN